jgi:hypothetical protein
MTFTKMISWIKRTFVGFLAALAAASLVELRFGRSFSIYTVVRSIPTALVSPTIIIPSLYYGERLRSQELMRRMMRGDTSYDTDGGNPEGYFWGVLVGGAFYVPFYVIKNKTNRIKKNEKDNI